MKSPNQTPDVVEPTTFYLESYAVTVAGSQKQQNKVSTLDLSEYGLFCIADGMGEGTAAKTASEYVIDTIKEQCWDTSLDSEKKLLSTLKESISRAKIRIQRFSRSNDLEGVGSTITILHINPIRNSAFILYAGNTRVYRFRDKTLTQLTQDHSMTGELGLSDKEDVSHIVKENVTKAVGLYDTVNPDTKFIEFLGNDIFMMSSIGLHKILDDAEITDILATQANRDLEAAANKLEEQIKQRSSEKDISAILVQVVSDSAKQGTKKKKPFFVVFGTIIGVFLLVAGLFYFFRTAEDAVPQGENQKGFLETSSQAENTVNDVPAMPKDRVPETGTSSSVAPESDSPPSDTQELRVTDEEVKKTIPPPTMRQAIGDEGILEGQQKRPIAGAKPNGSTYIGEIPKLQNTGDEVLPAESSSSEFPDTDTRSRERRLKQDTGTISDELGQEGLSPPSRATADNQSSQETQSIDHPIVISNPPVGTSQMLVEEYSNGRIEVSKLSEPQRKAHATKREAHTPKPADAVSRRDQIAPPPTPSQKPPPSSPKAADVDNVISRPDMLHTGQKPGHPKEEVSAAKPASETEAKVTSVNVLKILQDASDVDGVSAALTQISGSWKNVVPSQKIELRNLIIEKLGDAVTDIKTKHYQKGDELLKVLNQLSEIEDSDLRDEVDAVLLAFETDFANYLKTEMLKAKETCDWTPVSRILLGNKEMNRELGDLSILHVAEAWCGLVEPSEQDRHKWTDYIKRIEKLSSRIRPLVDLRSESKLSTPLSTNKKDLPPGEKRCQEINYSNDNTRDKLLMAIARLQLNIGVIEPEQLEALIDSSGFDTAETQTYQNKSKFVNSGLVMLTTIKEDLNAINDGQDDPHTRLDRLEDSTEKLIVLFYRTQHHLRLIANLLTGHRKVTEDLRKSIFRDIDIVDEYMSKHNKIHSIFSSQEARELKRRFSESFISRAN